MEKLLLAGASGVAEWNRVRPPKVDLRGIRLPGCDLRGADLRAAKLQLADLKRAQLDGALLDGSVLCDADLTAACLESASMRKTDLRNANLALARLTNVSLQSSDLRSANLSQANLERADLSASLLSRADMTSSIFKSAVLSRCTLGAGSDEPALDEPISIESDKQGALMGFSPGADDAYVEEWDEHPHRSRELSDVDFSGADLTEAEFRQAHLDNSDFSGADLSSAYFDRSVVSHCQFEDAKLNYARLVASTVSDSQFDRCEMRFLSMVDTRVIAASFRGADLTDTVLRQSWLTHVDWNGANVARMSQIDSELDYVALRRALGHEHLIHGDSNGGRVAAVKPMAQDTLAVREETPGLLSQRIAIFADGFFHALLFERPWWSDTRESTDVVRNRPKWCESFYSQVAAVARMARSYR